MNRAKRNLDAVRNFLLHTRVIEVGLNAIAHDWTALRNSLPSPTTLNVTEGPLAQADKETQPRRAFVIVDYSDGGPPAKPKQTFERGIGFAYHEYAGPLAEPLVRHASRWRFRSVARSIAAA